MASQLPLVSNFVVGNLRLHHCQVHYTTPCISVVQTLRKVPTAPGLIVVENSRIVGVISRRKFLAHMSLPQNRETYLQRPVVQAVVNWVKAPPLELPFSCTVQEAVEQALSRPREIVYEPLVIQMKDKSYRLLDLHVLLLTYTQFSALINRALHERKPKPEQNGSSLVSPIPQAQAPQNPVKPRSANLDRPPAPEALPDFQPIQPSPINPQARLNSRRGSVPGETRSPGTVPASRLPGNHLSAPPLSSNGSSDHGSSDQRSPEVLRHLNQLNGFNQKLIQAGQSLSLEGQQAFQGTQDTVHAIYQNNDRLIAISKILAKELAAVHNASELIHRLSRQVRFLGLHTAILANRFGSGELDGFSRVASEIGQLNHQTLEAGQRVDEVSEHLKACVEELIKLAQSESGMARSLAPKISRAKSALTDMEKLLERKNQYVVSNPLLDDTSEDTVIQGKIQPNKPIGNKVLEQDISSEYRDLQNLIRQAEQNLEQSKRNTRFEWNLP
jgi:hypothetical protein